MGKKRGEFMSANDKNQSDNQSAEPKHQPPHSSRKKPGFTHWQIGGIVGALAIAVFLVIAMFGYYHQPDTTKQQDQQLLIPGAGK